ncbi:unnamed protein product [Brassica napus]|uniref:(rape) hypothetical protein n=1 Tax=Brassica napus TaxID=3708 RepID=A0A816JHH5_BRANA|nr:unnamed protein product [Brassica napus]
MSLLLFGLSYSVVLLSALAWRVSPVNHPLVWSDDSGGYQLHLESSDLSSVCFDNACIRKAIGGNDKSELRRHGVLVFYKLMVSFGGPRAATIYSD